MTYYDAEIEYLESTGTQYIQLSLSANAGQYFGVSGYMIPLKTSSGGILGTSPYQQFDASYYSGSTTITYASSVGNVTKNGGWGGTTNAKTYFELSTEGKTNNGVFSSLNRPLTASINGFRIFSSYRSANSVKFCSFKITVGDSVIYDLIPVRIGSVGYMYDKVSDTLFGNTGTGSFVLGPDVAGWPGVIGKPKVSSIRRQMIQLMPKHDSKYRYIQDGLIFQLDGINKGTNEGAWTDLVGGHIYTNYGATVLENGWRLNNKSLRSTDCNFLPANSNQTVEIVFKPTVNSGPQAVWMQNGNQDMTTNTVLLFWNGTAVTFLQHNKTYTIPLTVNAYHCISLNLTLGLVNGVKKNPNTNNDYWNNTTDYSVIGCRNGGAAYFKGDIFAIRVYDRRLTEDEMLHNQQVDNIRFNLGLGL